MAQRIVYFLPTVALTLNDKGEATKLKWDWADSFVMTLIDHGESLEENLEDEEACEVMDGLIIDNHEDMRWV